MSIFIFTGNYEKVEKAVEFLDLALEMFEKERTGV
jgi:hypothetical protein